MKQIITIFTLLTLLIFGGCASNDNTTNNNPAAVSVPTQNYPNDVATGWMSTTYNLIRISSVSPPVAARIVGYTTVALYEAVVPGMSTHQSLAGQLHDLPELPATDGTLVYHWPTVANSAIATVLRLLYANGSTAVLDSISVRETAFAADYRNALAADVFSRSVVQGQLVGLAIFNWSLTDGYPAQNNCSYTPPTGPGHWVPTPPAYAAALQPCWGHLRPMIMITADACLPPVPLTFSADTSSAFYRDAWEVYHTTENLTAEQRDIANYWADGAGPNGGTPPGHTISIVTQIVRRRNITLDVAAEAYARVGIAVNDAFISCWNAKFTYNLLRPITYIQTQIDATWTPLLTTPNFPEYTSGHSAQCGAAAHVLTDFFGDIPFIDSTHVAQGMAPRSFTTFFGFANEAAISRLYGGIHFRAAIERGITQGICVGETVTRLHFHR